MIKSLLFNSSQKQLSSGVSVKMMFLKISQNPQEDNCARVSLKIKLQALTCNVIKKDTLAQVFPCEFRKILKNTFFNRSPPLAASVFF